MPPRALGSLWGSLGYSGGVFGEAWGSFGEALGKRREALGSINEIDGCDQSTEDVIIVFKVTQTSTITHDWFPSLVLLLEVVEVGVASRMAGIEPTHPTTGWSDSHTTAPQSFIVLLC